MEYTQDAIVFCLIFVIVRVCVKCLCADVCADDETNSSPAQTCSVKSGKREFSCLERSQCASDYTPVCASDTNSYNNRCLMKVAGCDRDGRNDTTEVARQGQCSFGTEDFVP